MTPGGRLPSSLSKRSHGLERGYGSGPVCVDCIAEGIVTRRDAPYKGPRCHTHHKRVSKARSGARKAGHINRTYNLTEAKYAELLRAQGGVCAICRRVKSTDRRRLSVDHDHSCCSGKTSCGKCIRGLLCTRCNKYLGHIRDSPESMMRGQDYLLNPPARAVLDY